MAEERIKVHVVEGQQLHAGVRSVVGTIKAGHLSAICEVPSRDYYGQTGYQRPLTRPRVSRLANDLQNGTVDLPTAVLINMRQFDDSWLEMDGTCGVLNIPAGTKAYIVDGQHRIAALDRLIEEDYDRWANYLLHFVLMLGADELQEMRQFFVVNSTAKSVRTDLAYDLLRQQADSDPDLMGSLIAKGEDWKVKAQALTDHLGRESAIWKDRIRFPGEPKGKSTITSASMVSSLQALVRHPYFGALNTESQAKILDAYWLAISQTLPSVFAEPAQYSIQKGIGASVMHGVFPQVLEVVRSSQQSVVAPASYEEVLGEVLCNLTDFADDGEYVQGEEFWRQGPEGAAGRFTSRAGHRVLQARITNQMPSPEVR